MNIIPAAERKLLAAILGLAGDKRIVRGIGTKALAVVADLDRPRDVSPAAERLAERGLIVFTPGTFRQTHSYVPQVTVRTRLQVQLTVQSCNRLRDALRKRVLPA